MASSPVRERNRRRIDTDESFKVSQIFEAFTSLPRVLRLVWSTHAWLTSMMALISLARGFLPAITVTITALLIDSVVRAIHTHDASTVWLFVGLQLAVGLLDRFLSV